MNGTVRPVDDRLLALLKPAAKVMKKVETDNFKRGNVKPESLVENDNVQYLSENEVSAEHRQSKADLPKNILESVDIEDDAEYIEKVKKSNFPDSIKEVMLKNRIKQPKYNVKSSINLMEDDDHEKHEKKFVPRTPEVKKEVTTKQTINENIKNSGDLITISKNELMGLVKDMVIEVFKNDYSKNLTENVIKQTINTLIKEGKLTVRKKI